MDQPWSEIENGVILRIKVVPGASRDGIAGRLDDRLKVRIAAPPEDGKANDALCRLLAKTLDVSMRSLAIESGRTRAEKRVRVIGVTCADVARIFSAS